MSLRSSARRFGTHLAALCCVVLVLAVVTGDWLPAGLGALGMVAGAAIAIRPPRVERTTWRPRLVAGRRDTTIVTWASGAGLITFIALRLAGASSVESAWFAVTAGVGYAAMTWAALRSR